MTRESILYAAIQKASSAERAAYLDGACGSDAKLREEIEALIQAHQAKSNPLDRPPGIQNEATAGFGQTQSYTPSEPTPGVVIAGRYTLEQKLGEGGMGEVWVAKQSEPVKRRVAIKLIKAGMDSRSVVQRFEQERQALAMMDHPHIAKVLDGGIDSPLSSSGGRGVGVEGGQPTGRPFFVMELVNGLPLTRFCDEAQLGIKERLELFVPICQAVQHAHQKGIVHRDLKPGNILVTLIDGKAIPKVIDFGVAKATGGKLTDESMATQFGAVIGTLEYMAPEQAGFSSTDVDTRADIYSLGVILYELLTGLRPFDSKRLKEAAFDEMIRIIREVEPSKPSTRLSTDDALPSLAAVRHIEPGKLTALLRGELDWVVMKCLEKQRDRRYETANGLARDIQRYLANETVEARPPSAGYRLRKFVARNRGKVLAAGLMLGLLLAGIVGTTWGLLRAQTERDAKEKAFQAEAEQRLLAEQAEKEARAQAASVQAVNDFLQNDLLNQANTDEQTRTGQTPDRDVSVRVLLDRAAKGITDKFKDQPVVEASIRQTIGETYRHLGQRAEAQSQLARSLELRRRTLGAEHPDTLAAITNLGQVYADQARFDEAEPLYLEALEGYRRRGGDEHVDVLIAMNNLARVYMGRNQHAKAEALFVRRLELSSRLLGDDSPKTLIAMTNLADCYRVQGKPAEAEPLATKALDGFRKCYGPDHTHTMTAVNNLAVTHFMQERYDAAEPLLLELLAQRRRILGDDHPSTIRAMHNLTTLYSMSDRYAQAEPLAVEALERGRRIEGESHPVTLSYLSNMAELRRLQKRYPESERLYRELVEKSRKVDGPASTRTTMATVNLCNCLISMGRSAEAEPLLRNLLALREKSHPGDWSTFAIKSQLGETLLNQKKYAEAEPLLLKGYEGLKQREKTIPRQGKGRLPEALDRLILLYTETNKPDEAKKWQVEKENFPKPVTPATPR